MQYDDCMVVRSLCLNFGSTVHALCSKACIQTDYFLLKANSSYSVSICIFSLIDVNIILYNLAKTVCIRNSKNLWVGLNNGFKLSTFARTFFISIGFYNQIKTLENIFKFSANQQCDRQNITIKHLINIIYMYILFISKNYK